MNNKPRNDQGSGQVVLQINQELRDVKYRDGFSKGIASWENLRAYYEELNDEEKYGIDGNGIYFKNEYLMTLTPGRNGKTEAYREDETRGTIIDLIRQEVYFNREGEKKGPYYFKMCPCGGNIIKIFGEDIHEIMEGGSGSEAVTREGGGTLKKLSGASRNYLTYLKKGLGEGLSSLRHLIQLDHFNIGDRSAPIIAVIDTGLDLFLSYKGSPESIKLWANPGGSCKSLCNDRFGYNFIDGNENVFDDHGHGTEVTSVFVENFGWKKDYRIMVLKAFDGNGHGGSYETACAIYYAIRHHADIIVASWGGPQYDPNVYLALKAAQDKNIVTFAACGNFGEDISAKKSPFYPALHGYSAAHIDLKLKNLYPIGATEKKKENETDLWLDSSYHDLVLATDGKDVRAITCSYSLPASYPGGTLNAPPAPYNFKYLDDLPGVFLNGVSIGLKYYTKDQKGTSFATPKAAAKYLLDSTLPNTVKPSTSKSPIKFKELA